MTLKEIRKRKQELKKKVIEARSEDELGAIKEELIALQEAEKLLEEKIEELSNTNDKNEKNDPALNEDLENTNEQEDEKEITNERKLIKTGNPSIEKRNINDLKILKKEDEKNMEEKNILETQEYRSAFLKRLQGKPLNEAEKRAMTTAKESVGAGIPTTLNRIEEKLRQTSALFNEIEVLNLPRIFIDTKRKCNK